MGMGELEWEVRSIISNVLEIEPEKIGASVEFVKAMGADPRQLADIFSRLGKKFDIDISGAKAEEIKNLTQLIDHLTPRLDARHKPELENRGR